MTVGGLKRLGLVVRSAPWSGRSGRDQLDIALAAASLGVELDLYFLAEGLLQLAQGKQPAEAGLPAGLKGWKSLPGLTTVRAFALSEGAPEPKTGEDGWLLNVRFVDAGTMVNLQDECDRLLVI